MDETARRREKQLAFNVEHGITARGVIKAVRDLIDGVTSAAAKRVEAELEFPTELLGDAKKLAREIKRLEKQMMDHAKNLEFEEAAQTRDQLRQLKEQALLS